MTEHVVYETTNGSRYMVPAWMTQDDTVTIAQIRAAMIPEALYMARIAVEKAQADLDALREPTEAELATWARAQHGNPAMQRQWAQARLQEAQTALATIEGAPK